MCYIRFLKLPQINYTIKISLYGCYPSGTHFKQFGSSIQTHLGTVLNPLTLGLFFTHHKPGDKHYIIMNLNICKIRGHKRGRDLIWAQQRIAKISRPRGWGRVAKITLIDSQNFLTLVKRSRHEILPLFVL